MEVHFLWQKKDKYSKNTRQNSNYLLYQICVNINQGTELLGAKHGVAGPRYFKYNGEWLSKIRAKLEGRAVSNRIDDVWIIPCNPKLYDIVGAFNNLDVIEWSQPNNTAVGDTVYIYVGGSLKSIMNKCEVVAMDLYGNRALDDIEYYHGLEKRDDVRYMKIKLLI